MNAAQQAEWQQQVLAYSRAINAYVDTGLREGWDAAGKEPAVPELQHLLQPVVEHVRAAFAAGNDRDLKAELPISHEAMIPLLEHVGCAVMQVLLLDDGSILTRIGDWYQDGGVMHVRGHEAHWLEDILFIGRSADRRHYAAASAAGIRVTEGWQGREVARFDWPTGQEGLLGELGGSDVSWAQQPNQLIPFDEGQRLLLVSSHGIWVLAASGATRLLPTDAEIEEDREDLDDDEAFDMRYDMPHGAASPDNRWIAVGNQGSAHLVFDRDLNLVASIGPHSEYPHFACFSEDGRHVAFNACHFYNGTTIGVAVADLPGMDTDYYADDPRQTVLQDGARVYAAVSRPGELIIGEANGYVRGVGWDGQPHWFHHLGSTISGMDISADGRTLVVGSHAGYLSIIQLDAEAARPYQIGNARHWEEKRWFFWQNTAPFCW